MGTKWLGETAHTHTGCAELFCDLRQQRSFAGVLRMNRCTACHCGLQGFKMQKRAEFGSGVCFGSGLYPLCPRTAVPNVTRPAAKTTDTGTLWYVVGVQHRQLPGFFHIQEARAVLIMIAERERR